jgi:hypothetical protein
MLRTVPTMIGVVVPLLLLVALQGERMSQALSVAASIVLGVVVSLLTNLITAGFTVPLAVGLGVTVLAWVTLAVVTRPRSGEDTGGSVTHGPSSPIVNAQGNSGVISVNASSSGPGASSPERGDGRLWRYSAGGGGRRVHMALFRPS